MKTILLISALLLISCGTEPQVESCEEYTFYTYTDYQVEPTYIFINADREIVTFPAVQVYNIQKGKTYIICSKNGKITSLETP